MLTTTSTAAHGPRLDITTEESSSGVTLRISGEIDVATARRLYDAIVRATTLKTPPDVTVDFEAVSFCDSSGLSALIRAYRRIQHMHGSLTLTHLSDRCLRILKTTGLTRFFTITDSPPCPA